MLSVAVWRFSNISQCAQIRLYFDSQVSNEERIQECLSPRSWGEDWLCRDLHFLSTFCAFISRKPNGVKHDADTFLTRLQHSDVFLHPQMLTRIPLIASLLEKRGEGRRKERGEERRGKERGKERREALECSPEWQQTADRLSLGRSDRTARLLDSRYLVLLSRLGAFYTMSWFFGGIGVKWVVLKIVKSVVQHGGYQDCGEESKKQLFVFEVISVQFCSLFSIILGFKMFLLPFCVRHKHTAVCL